MIDILDNYKDILLLKDIQDILQVDRNTVYTYLAKTVESKQTYPIDVSQLEMFKQLKEEEQKNRELLGTEYQENDYIFKHEDGSLYYPDYPS